MEKHRNCWLYGLKRSVLIIALVSNLTLIVKGLSDMAYVFVLIVMLAIGTLLLGGIEHYYQLHPEKRQKNGN